MELSDDDRVALGNYCEDLLQQRSFNEIVQCYELSTTQALLSTAPQERDIRERHYHELKGVSGLLSMMIEFVKIKDQLINPPPSAEADADLED